MKLLKRQKGLPFLLALGVLFILSASFLAVQLWSDKDSMRGSVQALETPVMPPVVPKLVDPPPVQKKSAKSSEKEVPVASADVSSESLTIVSETPVTPVNINAAEVKPIEEKPVEQKTVEIVPVPKPVKVVKTKAAATKPVSAKIDTAEKPAKKAISTPKKTRKTAKKAVEVVPTEIPVEWNWFSKPLKLNLDAGKAEITISEHDTAIMLSPDEKVKGSSVVVASVETAVSESTEVSEEAVTVAEPATRKPFMLALAKMARIRQMRQAAATVEKTPVVGELSPSLRRMGETLRALCEKLDRQPAATATESLESPAVAAPVAGETSVEEVPANTSTEDALVETSDTEKAGSSNEEAVLKPYYGGSGSSFSSRINKMLKDGMIKID